MPISTGKAIKLIREAKGLSLSALAKNARLSKSYLSLLESGSRKPSVDALRQVAEALGIPPDVLILIAAEPSTELTTKNGLVARLVDLLTRVERVEEEIRDAVER